MEILPFLIFVILGFVIQRRYLCLYESLTAALIIKNYQRIRIIVWAILTAMIFYHFLAYLGIISLVSQPFYLPGVIIGAILFAVGMVITGSCMLGILLKVGSGLINHFIVFLGVFFGLALGKFLILEGPMRGFYQLGLTNSKLSSPTLASFLNLNPWLTVISLSFLMAWFLYKFRSPEVENFKKPWPASIAGITLGILVTVSFARWNVSFFPTLFQKTSSFDAILTQFPVFLWFLLTYSGILLGIVISSLISREFRIRWIRLDKRKLILAFFGGLLMGFGIVLANGCNIIHLFVFLPQLSLGSFLFVALVVFIVWLITRFRFKGIY